MSLHFFELKKLDNTVNTNKKDLWFHFIDVIIDMSKSGELRETARRREEELHERASMLGSARAEGLAKGISEGITKGKTEIINKLRLSGMTEEQIEAILSK